jgi:CHASE2 domain-containing sensor protein
MNPSDDNVQQSQAIEDSSIENSEVQMAQSESGKINQSQQNAQTINNTYIVGSPLTYKYSDMKKPNESDSTIQNNSGLPHKRRRSAQKQTNIEAEWNLRNNKLLELRKALAIETQAADKFKLDQQIQIEEEKLVELEKALDNDENELDTQEIYESSSQNEFITSPLKSPDKQQSREIYKYGNQLKKILTKSGLRSILISVIARNLVISSLLVSSIMVGLRSLGFFEQIELEFFDTLTQQRQLIAPEKPDNRILIIKATPEDIQSQKKKPENNATLSEDTLNKLFSKLIQYEPTTIGLDINRDFSVDAHLYPKLASALSQKNLFSICKRKSKADSEGIAPPLNVNPGNIGFNDASDDADGVLRRHILSMEAPSDPKDSCTATNNLSLKVAYNYLSSENPSLHAGLTSLDDIEIENAVFKRINSSSGSYQRIDAGGRQILLNYRALNSPLEISPTVTLGDILNDKIPKNRIKELKGKIILIGLAKPVNSSNDYWKTPYRINYFGEKESVPGVFIQAHMISQIISTVQNQRILLWTWTDIEEILWIFGWSIIGWVIGSKFCSPLYLLISISLASILLYGICYALLLYGGWIPLIPSEIVLLLSSFAGFRSYHQHRRES